MLTGQHRPDQRPGGLIRGGHRRIRLVAGRVPLGLVDVAVPDHLAALVVGLVHVPDRVGRTRRVVGDLGERSRSRGGSRGRFRRGDGGRWGTAGGRGRRLSGIELPEDGGEIAVSLFDAAAGIGNDLDVRVVGTAGLVAVGRPHGQPGHLILLCERRAAAARRRDRKPRPGCRSGRSSASPRSAARPRRRTGQCRPRRTPSELLLQRVQCELALVGHARPAGSGTP